METTRYSDQGEPTKFHTSRKCLFIQTSLTTQPELHNATTRRSLTAVKGKGKGFPILDT